MPQLAESKAAGRKDAAETAWEATAAKYPPLTNAGGPAAEAPAAVADKGPPWKDLPDSIDIDEDRRWAYNWASSLDRPHGDRGKQDQLALGHPAAVQGCLAANDGRSFQSPDLH